MNKEDLEKLQEYSQRQLEWCLESGAITQHLEPGVVYPAAQNHWRNRAPWPFTQEEGDHYRELQKTLSAEAAEAEVKDAQHLVFYTQDDDYKIAFLK